MSKVVIRAVLKPCSSTVKKYAPGCTLINTKNPLPLVRTWSVILVPWLVSFTSAPETAAPLESVTVPFTAPVAVCARTAAADTNHATRTIAVIFSDRMDPSLHSSELPNLDAREMYFESLYATPLRVCRSAAPERGWFLARYKVKFNIENLCFRC